jgi:lambda repressor-like predicted transcriptional regulator
MKVREIIAESGLSLQQLNRDSGVPYGTLRVWSNSDTEPTRESWERLAEGLQKRAERLAELAEQAGRAAKEAPP